MSQRNMEIGNWGERVAIRFLKDHHYVILASKTRTPHGEIDIVSSKGGITIFVEVKTRTSQSYGPPETAITPRKQAHMLAAAEYYAQENEIDHWQIDVIAINGQPGNKPNIAHFENAIR